MSDLLLRLIHGRNLVYNACWEDPRIDRQLLALDAHSRVLMITSAGCNALDYLLDNPARVICVDINHRQNALLGLKLKMAERLEYSDFRQLFGNGSHPEYRAIFAAILPELLPKDRQYWQKRQAWFNPRSMRGSFYFHGSFGTNAWLFRKMMRATIRNYDERLARFFDSASLEEQSSRVSSAEIRRIIRLHCRQAETRIGMALNGISSCQVRMIRETFPGGMPAFIAHYINHTLLKTPIRDNYFWRVSLFGAYAGSCAPNYLQKGHFEVIKSRLRAIETHHQSVSGFLKAHPSSKFSHFVLLDHLDWLACTRREELEEEWRLILRCSMPGTRILFRSAASNNSFLHGFVFRQVKFYPELTTPLNALERPGTYGSLHLGIVGA